LDYFFGLVSVERSDEDMNYLITPPNSHFDGGLGITGHHFRNAAKILSEHGSYSEGVLPLCYLYRHSIELFLKSFIFILHKRFSLKFPDEFSLESPGILVRGKWVALDKTHNIADLFTYFESVYLETSERMPSTTNWTLPEGLKSKINVVSGSDPKSTFFRYPTSGSTHQDEKKSKIQKIDFDEIINNKPDKPMKIVLMFDQNDELVESYDFNVDALSELKNTLEYLSELFDALQVAFRCELTNGL
jgi:hypothetical protein